ncbi:PREDICTED: inactive N-acetylated-alpha-linked acidic dipeptidase-like protein 2 isoform X2 [Lepidothrix coronata]|nr:PREDICTED: inactive N-acetylated-alpha-linked acidic dipeptidase-like protein 2 isoform X2 [Lepidothrix coronata]XP_017683264.1 PREDICTED: inactive N-acetylated-alpha-linked acidic dipeptidase-like protein 2 isoform X2 [Lepidothrix coronata]XP_017683265.1 PREDICTED: inactive N-acetylated-alpha-linked acidic dipeptidase-like protein 2 isoform X2 [Lepidothrix coronata]XP_017683266.1 PREDICTED: inactive N-acetylated-alpha-linked acidic dipeptidase-like protein 2 isoform X2 [Lepidothrix coronata]
MAYHKVNADQRAQGHSPYLDNDELQATALELEWDMEKELEEPGFDHFRLDSAVQHHLGNSQSPDLDLEPIQASSSPKGRFQRLQEDPDYISHYTRQAPKSNRCSFFRILKVFCTALILFIFGIVIGYYARKKCPSPPASQEPNNPHIYHEILKEIKAENIQQIYRDLLQYTREDDVDVAMKILVQWHSQGLEDVRLVNYSVLLDLPDSSSNTVTLKSSGECFYPSGQQCSRDPKTLHSQDLLYSYAAYSAKGTLEAELVDVQYGTMEDLLRIQAITNVTKKIALLKLGQSPLLYKLSLLEDAGFGGVLLYADPCDLPKTTDLADKAFMVSLNSGGDPSTPGYASIDGSYRQNRLNLTTLLVQPISAMLARKLVSLPEDSVQKDRCTPLQLPPTGKKIISLNIQSVTTYKTISNVIGYLKGAVFPDRYIIIGSHHSSLNPYGGQGWASSTAVITALIQALTLKAKRGWRPDRTIVFCSWGGTAFGNIGSYEWAEDLKRVLQRNVVAYVSLHDPVRGNSTLHPVASPSLQQLAAESQSLNCVEKTRCPGSNVSSVQIQGDSDYFINHLGVPATQFSYEDIKTSENSSFLSEALFPVHATKTEELDPSFSLHETIAKLTGQVTLKIANEPVLPFNALDIALEVQNSLKGDEVGVPQLLAVASRLRDTAELFQSDEMRPANDPKERAPVRVRMLNDVLQSLEKSFLVHQAPPGLYRNILYRLDERTSQFSVLLEALEHCKLHQSNETIQAALSEVLNSINSAQVYFKAGLDVFETTLAGKK